MTDDYLQVTDLVAGYVSGVNILDGCSFQAGRHELVGIIGPNGAGKSTLLKTIFGLVRVRSGTIRLAGQDITDLEPNRLVARGVGFVPQNNNVFPPLTVEENLHVGAYLKPREYADRLGFIHTLFPEIEKLLKQKAGSLSGGERQMVAMARALMTAPSVLLLDEPSAGLSPVRQDETFLRIHRIKRSGVCVVMVEQNARRCLQICDRAYVLDQGRDAYTGSGEELLHDPHVVRLYLGNWAESPAPEEAGGRR